MRARPALRTTGLLVAGPLSAWVMLGRAGIRANKREGDGATPRGRFTCRRLWWRADRGPRPRCALPIRRIDPRTAWCEDPTDRRYNRPFRRGTNETGDRLWREDHLYDFNVEIDHNSRPRVAGRGSAVFIHLMRPARTPTAGCVALTRPALLRLLGRIGPETRIDIR